ncbi:MAG: response regulator [Candidatus Berkelbacteria bacterium]
MPIINAAGLSLQQVIVIDDEECILRLAKKLLNRDCTDCDITLFNTAEAAVNELQERSRNETLVPTIVIIDGNLSLDSGFYRLGHEVVRHLRSMEFGDKLHIIAHSGETESNKKMLQAGANVSVIKNEILTLPEVVSAAFGRN